MDTNSRNQLNDVDQNMYGMRKNMYLQKYGVKCFPYRGMRRYTTSISQSLDRGIFISNDVFGLTIRQFERIFKDCLDRRKTKEQWILNLRYPDKSSNEYLEYLQNCVYFNKDILPWPVNDLKEKSLYKHLVNSVGSEIVIRNKQRLSIINDMKENYFVTDAIQISSGSFAEGFDLQGSDEDTMFICNNVDVVQNLQSIKYPIEHTTLVMESDDAHAGFTRLKLAYDAKDDAGCAIDIYKFCESTRHGSYLSVEIFLDNFKQKMIGHHLSLHGPCLSDAHHNFDFVICLRIKSLPYSALPWVKRHRHQWPPNFVIDNIQKYGCLLLPIGPKTIPGNRLLWRLSFSVAEKQLTHSFNFTQLLCYGLLKLTLKRIINTNVDVKDLLCSYYLKTALFWVSEEVDIEIY